MSNRTQALDHGLNRKSLLKNAAGAELQCAETIDLGQIIHPEHGLALRPGALHVRNELEDYLQAARLIHQNDVWVLGPQDFERIAKGASRPDVFQVIALREHLRQALQNNRL